MHLGARKREKIRERVWRSITHKPELNEMGKRKDNDALKISGKYFEITGRSLDSP